MEYVFVAAIVGLVHAGVTEEEAKVAMDKYSKTSLKLKSTSAYKEWDNDILMTDETGKALEIADENYNQYQEDSYAGLMKFPWKNFKDPFLKRQFWMVSFLDEAALSKEKRNKLSQIKNQMLSIYDSAEIKEFESPEKKPSLNIDDIADKFANDFLNTKEMDFYWREWHNTVGRPEKQLFQQWVDLQNETAILNGFKNNAERWHKDFETKNFEKVMAKLYREIEPLFKELHAYIRYKLWIAHKKNSCIIDPEGPIPASRLGNMWGLDAINIFNITAPYPKKSSIDASAQLEAQNYTGLKMAKTAEQYYLSLGLEKMTESFWKYSVFERNKTTMDCSPVAFRFFTGTDYRIHFCTAPIQDDFCRMHHEMGHIENYMIQKDLPYLFQDAANPGFDEGIGDLLYIYACSPYNLKRIGLIDKNIKLDEELKINAIFTSAIADIFFLPYAYSLDLWRWEVMKGNIPPGEYNCGYWKKRIAIQGVEPPVDRDEIDFDPGAKHHVIAGDQYISYFVSGILKYQFLRSLCVTSGYYNPDKPSDDKPLVFCDIYNSKQAGDKLRKMMALGKSRPWPDALEAITGERELDTSALLEFYRPLYDWLIRENKKNKVKVGWNSGHKRCTSKKKRNIKKSTCKNH